VVLHHPVPHPREAPDLMEKAEVPDPWDDLRIAG
jgi:hypothetical protein